MLLCKNVLQFLATFQYMYFLQSFFIYLYSVNLQTGKKPFVKIYIFYQRKFVKIYTIFTYFAYLTYFHAALQNSQKIIF